MTVARVIDANLLVAMLQHNNRYDGIVEADGSRKQQNPENLAGVWHSGAKHLFLGDDTDGHYWPEWNDHFLSTAAYPSTTEEGTARTLVEVMQCPLLQNHDGSAVVGAEPSQFESLINTD